MVLFVRVEWYRSRDGCLGNIVDVLQGGDSRKITVKSFVLSNFFCSIQLFALGVCGCDGESKDSREERSSIFRFIWNAAETSLACGANRNRALFMIPNSYIYKTPKLELLSHFPPVTKVAEIDRWPGVIFWISKAERAAFLPLKQAKKYIKNILKTKQNKTKQNKTKQKKTKPNQTKPNQTKPNQNKQNKKKQN